MVKNIIELNERWWYRLLKVFFIIFFLIIALVVGFLAYEETSSKDYISTYSSNEEQLDYIKKHPESSLTIKMLELKEEILSNPLYYEKENQSLTKIGDDYFSSRKAELIEECSPGCADEYSTISKITIWGVSFLGTFFALWLICRIFFYVTIRESFLDGLTIRKMKKIINHFKNA